MNMSQVLHKSQIGKTHMYMCKECSYVFPKKLKFIGNNCVFCCIDERVDGNKKFMKSIVKKAFEKNDTYTYKWIYRTITVEEKQKKIQNITESDYNKLCDAYMDVVSVCDKMCEEEIKMIRSVIGNVFVFVYLFDVKTNKNVSSSGHLIQMDTLLMNNKIFDIIKWIDDFPMYRIFIDRYISDENLKKIMILVYLIIHMKIPSATIDMHKDISGFNLTTTYYQNFLHLEWTKKTKKQHCIDASDYNSMLSDIERCIHERSDEYYRKVIIKRGERYTLPKYELAYEKFARFLHNCDSNCSPMFGSFEEHSMRYEEFTLTPKQKLSFEHIREHPVSFITGEGGTGKSTIIASLIKGILDVKSDTQILILTPTGAAINVIKEKLDKYKVSIDDNVKTHTVHMFYKIIENMKRYLDKDETSFKEENDNLFNFFIGIEYLIIDECSMIGFDHMEKIADLFSEFENVRVWPRVIFSGDVHQLKSIDGSKFFEDFYKNRKDLFYELTENHRANPVLQAFLTNIRTPRKYYDREKYMPKLKIYLHPSQNTQNIKYMTYEECFNQMRFIYDIDIPFPNKTQAIYAKNISDNTSSVWHIKEKIRKFHTEKCSGNEEVVKHTFGNKGVTVVKMGEHTPKFEINERVVVTKNLYLGSQDEKVNVMNGEFGRVCGVTCFEFFIYDNMKKKNYMYIVYIYDVKFSEKKTISFHSIESDIPNKEHADYIQKCIKEKKGDITEKWFEKCSTMYLSQSYMITVHKSQGSQWDNVFYILDDVSNVDKNLFYTAISRARENIYIVYPKSKEISICDQSQIPIHAKSEFISSLY